MASRWKDFNDDQLNLLQEALDAYSDEVISNDNYYDEDEKEELKEIRDDLLEELNR